MFIGNSIQDINGNLITLTAYDELVTLRNCTFYNNELLDNAGLIKVNGSNAPVTIVGNNFINTSTDNQLNYAIKLLSG